MLRMSKVRGLSNAALSGVFFVTSEVSVSEVVDVIPFSEGFTITASRDDVEFEVWGCNDRDVALVQDSGSEEFAYKLLSSVSGGDVFIATDSGLVSVFVKVISVSGSDETRFVIRGV